MAWRGVLKIERSRPLNSKLFYHGLSVHHITNCVTYIELSFTTYGTTYLIPFAQFKKREKKPWRSVTFNKSNTSQWCFSRFINCTNDTKSRNTSWNSFKQNSFKGAIFHFLCLEIYAKPIKLLIFFAVCLQKIMTTTDPTLISKRVKFLTELEFIVANNLLKWHLMCYEEYRTSKRTKEYLCTILRNPITQKTNTCSKKSIETLKQGMTSMTSI